jgi:nucleotide-binding universal stress UspA family protein
MTQAVAAMRDTLREHSRDPRRYRVVVVEARPAPGIRRAIDDAQPDLVVLGTRGFGRFRRALLGSTAHEVLGSTDCDVLLVPDVAIRAARKVVRSRGAYAPLDDGPGAA